MNIQTSLVLQEGSHSMIIEATPLEIIEFTLSLSLGWNMIGTVGLESLNLMLIPNQVAERPPVTWQAPVFVEIETLDPGKAAWVFVTQYTEVVP